MCNLSLLDSKFAYNKVTYNKEVKMWIREYSKAFEGVKKEDVWALWTDINNWATWHGDLDYCKMDGAFEVGNYFMLKPKGAPAVKIELVEINNGLNFTDCTKFFGAKMYDTHTLEETEGGLRLSNKIIVTGWLSWLWIKLVAQHVADSIEEKTEELVKLARKNV
jgi:hypothetical protein